MQEINVLPGRIRLKVPQIRCQKNLAQYISVYLDNLYGVRYSSANPYTSSVLVVYDIHKTNRDIITQNLSQALSSAIRSKDSLQVEMENYSSYLALVQKRNKAIRKFVFYALIYVAFKIKHSLYGKFSLSASVEVLKLASAITIIGGYPALKGLYKKFTERIPPDSDALLTLAALSFTLMRESSKGVLVLMLKAFNDYIKYSADVEGYMLLRQNMGQTGGMAWLVTPQNQRVLVPAQSLKQDDIIYVNQGEIIPAAGEVTEGKAVVSSLYHTGQPVVTHVQNGSKVYEGVSVLSGSLTVRTAAAVESAGKPDISENLAVRKRVDKYRESITPVSMGAAALGYLLTGNILNAFSVLLVLTPSAPGTALSTGIKSYAALLNRHKIHLRNPKVFEKITGTDHIFFDKTGTLTHGIMKIEKIESFDSDYTADEILRIAAACEADNYHPISVTLQGLVKDGYDLSKVQSSVLIPSKGVIAQYGGRRVIIGNRSIMEENGIDISSGIEKYIVYESKLYTPVFISIGQRLVGLIALQDRIREGARELIDRLKQKGFTNISLLTGDNNAKAQDLAAKLGIISVYSNCSREDKLKIIQECGKSGMVMMVGDGVNDISAMKGADVSVSFADSACDKAKLHSDCIIFEDDITRLADLIELSKKASAKINQSVIVSQLYSLGLVIPALLGRIDAFAAKSLNTVNSLIVLLLNKRIEFLTSGKINADLGKIYSKS